MNTLLHRARVLVSQALGVVVSNDIELTELDLKAVDRYVYNLAFEHYILRPIPSMHNKTEQTTNG